jgi:mitochondrial splicing suppressor protein 51
MVACLDMVQTNKRQQQFTKLAVNNVSMTTMPLGARLLRAAPHRLIRRPSATSRYIFNLLYRSSKSKSPQEPPPLLAEDNLFHPFSKSPFPAVRARGDAIKSLAPCPVCTSSHHFHPHAQAQPKAVKFECPDCGWPTHCSEEHRNLDSEHQKYCARLHEANEDEHDLRSGRRMREFELPGM